MYQTSQPGELAVVTGTPTEGKSQYLKDQGYDCEWQPIDTAPRDRQIKLKGHYEPSAEAARHGAVACDVYGRGSFMWASSKHKQGFWSGILGGTPTHWAEV